MSEVEPIKFFWSPMTRASRVLWMLEEASVEYERITVDIRDPEAERHPAFAEASPMGKVPAIVDGWVSMSDSAAICMYLADRYPASRLAPAVDHHQRGAYLYWMVFTPGVIEPAMAERHSGVTPNRLSNGWGDFDTMIETLERGVRESHGAWVLGPRFSAADVMVGSSVLFMRAFNMLPDSGALNDYADRCAARPAYQAAQDAERG